ncbi:MAG: hypothetical protein NT013_25530 [Planctomycetia bacterium]|nr:hypothetical protein [Planctomycetia bacterium]
MSFTTTAIFYGLIGTSVAMATWLSDQEPRRGEQWFRIFTALLFWPVYLPLLLQPKAIELSESLTATSSTTVPDEFTQMIEQVENELTLALADLPCWADRNVRQEQARIAELSTIWRAKVERLRELDALLARPSFAAEMHSTTAMGTVLKNSERLALFEQSRQQSLAHLHAVRERLPHDLVSTLAAVRERITMIHVARFTGEPVSNVAELIAQIGAVVSAS